MSLKEKLSSGVYKGRKYTRWNCGDAQDYRSSHEGKKEGFLLKLDF